MKNILLIALASILMYAPIAHCQDTMAITEDGRKVVLHKNGTWKLFTAKQPPTAIPDSQFKKTELSTAVYKSKGDKFHIWYNPKKWHMKKSADSDKPTFEHKDGDLYAMVLAERFSMSLDALKELAISNAQEVAPDTKVTYEEERVVNGKKVLCMKIDGTISGVQFTYYGYYYAGKGGVIQLITYTAQNLLAEYEGEMAEFLNGLIVND